MVDFKTVERDTVFVPPSVASYGDAARSIGDSISAIDRHFESKKEQRRSQQQTIELLKLQNQVKLWYEQNKNSFDDEIGFSGRWDEQKSGWMESVPEEFRERAEVALDSYYVDYYGSVKDAEYSRYVAEQASSFRANIDLSSNDVISQAQKGSPYAQEAYDAVLQNIRFGVDNEIITEAEALKYEADLKPKFEAAEILGNAVRGFQGGDFLNGDAFAKHVAAAYDAESLSLQDKTALVNQLSAIRSDYLKRHNITLQQAENIDRRSRIVDAIENGQMLSAEDRKSDQFSEVLNATYKRIRSSAGATNRMQQNQMLVEFSQAAMAVPDMLLQEMRSAVMWANTEGGADRLDVIADLYSRFKNTDFAAGMLSSAIDDKALVAIKRFSDAREAGYSVSDAHAMVREQMRDDQTKAYLPKGKEYDTLMDDISKEFDLDELPISAKDKLAAEYFQTVSQFDSIARNEKEARQLALEKMKAAWRHSDAFDVLMKHPPDMYYPPVDGNSDYIFNQAAALVKEVDGVVIEDKSRIVLVPDGQTEREIDPAYGQPSYRLLYLNEYGGLSAVISPNSGLPLRFRPSWQTAIEEYSDRLSEENIRRRSIDRTTTIERREGGLTP